MITPETNQTIDDIDNLVSQGGCSLHNFDLHVDGNGHDNSPEQSDSPQEDLSPHADGASTKKKKKKSVWPAFASPFLPSLCSLPVPFLPFPFSFAPSFPPLLPSVFLLSPAPRRKTKKKKSRKKKEGERERERKGGVLVRGGDTSNERA